MIDRANTSQQQMLAQYQSLLQAQQLPCEHIVWHVTNRCNLACIHCGVWGGEKLYTDLTLEQFARHIPDMIRLGVKYVTLTGGEPLVRKDLNRILAVLKLSGFQVAMVTNGHFLERFEAKLKPYPLDSISISIDGTAPFHNRLRLSEVSFAETLKALAYAQKLEIPIRNVNTCVTPDNLGSLPELSTAIFAAGANHWILRPITQSGRADAALKSDLKTLKELLSFTESQRDQGLPVRLAGVGYMGPWHERFHQESYFDHTGWNSLYILPDGRIKGFNAEHLPVEGHLLHDHLPTVWWNGFSVYRHKQVPESCLRCEAYADCGGGNDTEAEAGYRCLKPLF